jgi:hypothetical protein
MSKHLNINDFIVIERNILDYSIKPKDKNIKEIMIVEKAEDAGDLPYLLSSDKLFCYYYGVTKYPIKIQINN